MGKLFFLVDMDMQTYQNKLKEHSDILFSRMGLNMTTALIEFTIEELESLENMETDNAIEFIKIRRKEAGR